ncbi:MAG: hypothetical protein SFT91_01095 [Rickettsiaceae bacterium]|nr:hypothetical protein [Rickettsiaceae bacterium]
MPDPERGKFIYQMSSERADNSDLVSHYPHFIPVHQLYQNAASQNLQHHAGFTNSSKVENTEYLKPKPSNIVNSKNLKQVENIQNMVNHLAQEVFKLKNEELRVKTPKKYPPKSYLESIVI